MCMDIWTQVRIFESSQLEESYVGDLLYLKDLFCSSTTWVHHLPLIYRTTAQDFSCKLGGGKCSRNIMDFMIKSESLPTGFSSLWVSFPSLQTKKSNGCLRELSWESRKIPGIQELCSHNISIILFLVFCFWGTTHSPVVHVLIFISAGRAIFLKQEKHLSQFLHG